ncbi:MAG: preprotein translocase subunit Sec61beta [Candidatus Micrarchaeota archaeon]|nr:preprotein translocase subunit Sec61beta [Candidatus Micrarchaeota archaeon]
MALSTPQQQAGILSFYDAPELGPKFSAKVLLIAVALFTLFVVILDHFAAL